MPASSPHRAVMAAMVALLVTDHADRGAGDSVRLGLVEPGGGEHRVEHAHTGDQPELDDADQREPGSAGADEGHQSASRR